jgi:hypothetical protein
LIFNGVVEGISMSKKIKTIEKLDSSRISQEKLPFTMHMNYVLQNVRQPLALAIWVYLTSLPDDWIVHRNQLMEHFDVGRDKLANALKYLNENKLIEYVQEKLNTGKFGDSQIFVKSGYEFEVIHKSLTAPLKNRNTVLPLHGETAPTKEITITKEITDTKKSSYTAPVVKSVPERRKGRPAKADWKEENEKKPAWAESKDQMAREDAHTAQNEIYKALDKDAVGNHFMEEIMKKLGDANVLQRRSTV